MRLSPDAQRKNKKLHEAIRDCDTKKIEELISKGADVNWVSPKTGFSAMFICWSEAPDFIIPILVRAGADINLRLPANSPSPYIGKQGDTHVLHVIRNGGIGSDDRVAVLRVLVSEGADLQIRDRDGNTPLCLELNMKREGPYGGEISREKVEIMVNGGAKLGYADRDGNCALHLATKAVLAGLVDLMIKAGANVNQTGWQGWTALHYAAEKGGGRNSSTATAIVQMLLAAGAVVDQLTDDGYTPLVIASGKGSVEIARELLQAGADKGKVGKGDISALSLAKQKGHDKLVSLLQEHTATTTSSARSSSGATSGRGRGTAPVRAAAAAGTRWRGRGRGGGPLTKPARVAPQVGIGEHLRDAVKKSDAAEVRRLLKVAGADVNWSDKNGDTALHGASQVGDPAVVQVLLDVGANENKANARGATPMYVAAEHGHADTVRRLLAAGADKDKTNSGGNSPLHTAAAHGHVEVVRVLIDAGASKSKANSAGKVPLDIAKEKVHTEIVELLQSSTDGAQENGLKLVEAATNGDTAEVRRLLQNGATDVNWASEAYKMGRTALVGAAVEGHTQIARMLLDAGADKDKATIVHGNTPLFCAAHHDRHKIATMLLDAGADKDKAKHTGLCFTPLHTAVDIGRTDMVRLLLEAGADKDKADKRGQTPLHIAAATFAADRVNITHLLLGAGADKDKVDNSGRTPLFLAAESGRSSEVVRVLLEAGSDKNRADNHGKTPLDIAKEKDHTEIVALLEDARPVPTALDVEAEAAAQMVDAQERQQRQLADGSAEADWRAMIDASGVGDEIARLQQAALDSANEAARLRAELHAIGDRVDANTDVLNARVLALEQQQSAQQSQQRKLEELQEHTNQLLHYRTLMIFIEAVFISAKSLAGGFTAGGGTAAQSAALHRGAKVMRVCGALLAIAPGGELLKSMANLAAGGLDSANKHRSEAAAKRLAGSYTMGECSQMASDVAYALTRAYASQLDHLVDCTDVNESGRTSGFLSFLRQSLGSLTKAYVSDGAEGAMDAAEEQATEFIAAGAEALLVGTPESGPTPFAQVVAEYCFLWVMTAMEAPVSNESPKEFTTRLIDTVVGMPAEADVERTAVVGAARSGARRLLARVTGAAKRGTKMVVGAKRSVAVYVSSGDSYEQVSLHALLTRCGLRAGGHEYSAAHCDVTLYGWCVGDFRHVEMRRLTLVRQETVVVQQQVPTPARRSSRAEQKRQQEIADEQKRAQEKLQLLERQMAVLGGGGARVASPPPRESTDVPPTNEKRGSLWGECKKCECDEYLSSREGLCGMCGHPVMSHEKLGKA